MRATGRQFLLESSEWNNGAFSKALVEGINGKANKALFKLSREIIKKITRFQNFLLLLCFFKTKYLVVF